MARKTGRLLCLICKVASRTFYARFVPSPLYCIFSWLACNALSLVDFRLIFPWSARNARSMKEIPNGAARTKAEVFCVGALGPSLGFWIKGVSIVGDRAGNTRSLSQLIVVGAPGTLCALAVDCILLRVCSRDALHARIIPCFVVRTWNAWVTFLILFAIDIAWAA